MVHGRPHEVPIGSRPVVHDENGSLACEDGVAGNLHFALAERLQERLEDFPDERGRWTESRFTHRRVVLPEDKQNVRQVAVEFVRNEEERQERAKQTGVAWKDETTSLGLLLAEGKAHLLGC